jgi:hypothetical protein
VAVAEGGNQTIVSVGVAVWVGMGVSVGGARSVVRQAARSSVVTGNAMTRERAAPIEMTLDNVISSPLPGWPERAQGLYTQKGHETIS